MQIECTGELKPCCLYKPHLKKNAQQYHIEEYLDWWTHHLEPLRQQVLKDEIDPGCSHCLSPDTPVHPMRSAANNMFDYTMTTSATPEWLDIRFGNYCNLKCIMCVPHNSSQIEQEYNNNIEAYRRLGISYPINSFAINSQAKNWWDHEPTFDQVVKIVKRAGYVNFSGGEPLMMPAFYRLINEMSSNCHVSINTNLTRVTERTIEAFKKFQQVLVSVSLDGVGAHQEYVRSGSNWAELDHNIQTVLQIPNVSLEFSYLLQHTSVYSWPALWNYLRSYNKKIFVTPVYGGTMGDGILTQHSVAPLDMQAFADWHKNNSTPYDATIDKWIQDYQFDPAKHQQYRDYVGMLDSIRGTDFVATFNPTW